MSIGAASSKLSGYTVHNLTRVLLVAMNMAKNGTLSYFVKSVSSYIVY